MIAGRPIMVERLDRLLAIVHDLALRAFQADLGHGLAEQQAILGLVDRLGVGADQLDPNFSSRPSRCSAIAVLSAVWPPMVGRMASGLSFSMILATMSGVIGSM